jgi:hypothetical protein
MVFADNWRGKIKEGLMFKSEQSKAGALGELSYARAKERDLFWCSASCSTSNAVFFSKSISL